MKHIFFAAILTSCTYFCADSDDKLTSKVVTVINKTQYSFQLAPVYGITEKKPLLMRPNTHTTIPLFQAIRYERHHIAALNLIFPTLHQCYTVSATLNYLILHPELTASDAESERTIILKAKNQRDEESRIPKEFIKLLASNRKLSSSS